MKNRTFSSFDWPKIWEWLVVIAHYATFFLCLCLVIYGVAQWSRPLALVVGGILGVVMTYLSWHVRGRKDDMKSAGDN